MNILHPDLDVTPHNGYGYVLDECTDARISVQVVEVTEQGTYVVKSINRTSLPMWEVHPSAFEPWPMY